MVNDCKLCKLVNGNVITKKYYSNFLITVVDCKTCLATITMGIVTGLINGYFMGNGVREERFGYFMNSIEEFGYYMDVKGV